MITYDCIVIGGGICGVSCVETISTLQPALKVLLISASPLVKVATRIRQITKSLEEFDVEEKPFEWVGKQNNNIFVIRGVVSSVNPDTHVVTKSDGKEFRYSLLCVCSGGKPKVIQENNPYVLGIRDTETVEQFQKKLVNARRVMIVGNGGIATEMVYELEGVEVVWAIKDSSISSAFVDAGAAEFFLNSLQMKRKSNDLSPSQLSTRLKYTSTVLSPSLDTYGSALGPDWAAGILMRGKSDKNGSLQIEYSCEVVNVLTPDEYTTKSSLTTLSEKWPVYVELTNGKMIGCDFIVSATGVVSNVDCVRNIYQPDGIALDGGIKVKQNMESFAPDIFAAGDVCSTSWEPAPHWFQMRLWSQARQMGAYAAKCMVAKLNHEEIEMDFAFELFAHATRFFGFKVVLLGLFNGQRLERNYELLLRVTKGTEFIKAIVKDGKLQGVILIGETDLEETFENLILNGTDISSYGEDLLNPEIDIEDYFD